MKSGQEILMFFILIDGLGSTVAVLIRDEELAMQAGKNNLGIEVNDIQDYEHVQEQLKEGFGRDVIEKRKYVLILVTIFCVLIFLLLVSCVCIGYYLMYEMLRTPS